MRRNVACRRSAFLLLHNIEDGSGKRNVSVSEGLIRDVDIKPPSAGAVLNAARLAAGQ